MLDGNSILLTSWLVVYCCQGAFLDISSIFKHICSFRPPPSIFSMLSLIHAYLDYSSEFWSGTRLSYWTAGGIEPMQIKSLTTSLTARHSNFRMPQEALFHSYKWWIPAREGEALIPHSSILNYHAKSQKVGVHTHSYIQPVCLSDNMLRASDLPYKW